MDNIVNCRLFVDKKTFTFISKNTWRVPMVGTEGLMHSSLVRVIKCRQAYLLAYNVHYLMQRTKYFYY